MILYVLLWFAVLPLLAVGSVLYVIKIIEARTHDKTSTWPQILTSEFVDLAASLVTGGAVAVLIVPAVALAWLRGQWRRLRSQFTEDAPQPAAIPLPARPAATAAPPRVASGPVPVALVPDLPDDVIDPGEAAAIQGSVVAADWAAVIARIATFEPEDDAALVNFIRAEAAAFGPLADGWRSLADTLINVIGVDPSAAHGVIELADTLSETAHTVALAQRRFVAVYAQVLEAVAGGLQLPHSGRWLTGGAA